MSGTPRELIFEADARHKLREGIDQLAEVVAVTLGPKGRNVGLQSSWGPPGQQSSSPGSPRRDQRLSRARERRRAVRGRPA